MSAKTEFTIPNRDVAYASVPQSELFEASLKSMARSIGVAGVVSGCSVDVVSGLTVSVSAGMTYHGGALQTISVGNVTADAAHATLYRLDLLVIDSGGNKVIRKGTAAAIGSVKEPAQSSGDVVLAQLYIPPTLTTFVADNHITGRQIFVRVDGTILIPCPAFPATPTGLQAANDSVSSDAAIKIAENTPIQFADSETVTFNKPRLRVYWPSSSPAKAPPTGVPYVLVKVGWNSGTGATTTVSSPAAQGDRGYAVASNSGFAKGDMIYVATTGYNRIVKLVNSNVIITNYPVPLDTAAGTSITKYIPIDRPEIFGLRIDNNGNWNPGVPTSYTPVASTTLTAGASAGDTTLTVADSTAFTADRVILLDYNGAVQLGEAKGYMTRIDSIPDSTHIVIDLVGPLPAAISNGATVEQINIDHVLPNKGLWVAGTHRAKICDISGVNVYGSVVRTQDNYEALYMDIYAEKSGHPYVGESLRFLNEMGSTFERTESSNAIGWGWWGDYLFYCRGNAKGVGSRARNVKLALSIGCIMDIEAHDGYTGFALNDGSSKNHLRVHAEGNDTHGMFLNGACNDNYIEFYGRSNIVDDIQITATDLRNKIKILNDDAVIDDAAGATGFRYVLTTGAQLISSASETSIAGSGVGNTLSIPANKLEVGDVLNIHAAGFFTTNGASQTMRLRILFGSGISPLDTGVQTIPTAGATISGWEFNGKITVRAIGTSGSLEAKGFATFAVAGVGSTVLPMATNTAFTLNTTVAQSFDFKATWGASSSANNITCTKLDIFLDELHGSYSR